MDDIGGTPVTRASTGFSGRAAGLQSLIADAHHYLSHGLGTDFAPTLLVPDPVDWSTAADDVPPYGIPYASDHEFELVVPADPAPNFLIDVYSAFGTRAEAERFADLIAVHELGHLHTRALGLTLPQGWLSEFLATYLACCYLRTRRPDDASLWFRLSRAGARSADSAHRSLEALDELYFGVGPTSYIWYQNHISTRVEQVQPVLGLDFALRLRTADLATDSDTRTTLAAAETICPGFEAWAEVLRA